MLTRKLGIVGIMLGKHRYSEGLLLSGVQDPGLDSDGVGDLRLC